MVVGVPVSWARSEREEQDRTRHHRPAIPASNPSTHPQTHRDFEAVYLSEEALGEQALDLLHLAVLVLDEARADLAHWYVRRCVYKDGRSATRRKQARDRGTNTHARTGERDDGDADEGKEDGEEAGVLSIRQDVPKPDAL